MNRLTKILLCGAIISASGVVVSQQTEPLPDIPGMIAIVGSDYNIYTLGSAGDGPIALTDDAVIEQTRARVYQYPTWSTDGRLAYFVTELNAGEAPTTGIFIAPDGQTPGEEAYTGENENIAYAAWSPRNCDAGENCRDLAVLVGRQSVGGFNVEVIRNSTEGNTQQIAGEGSPFYFSWSPEGTRLLRQRNNAIIDVFDLASRDATTIDETPGAFFVPAWSPIDDRLLLGLANGNAQQTDIAIVADDGVTRLVEGLEGPVSFAWSPDGNAIAFSDNQQGLRVIDAVTGEVTASSEGARVLAFFWSPDSGRIAYLTPAAEPGSFNISTRAQPEVNSVSWSILDVTEDTSWSYSPFVPTSEMIYLLTYFDQFAQSHSLWSPDSRHLVYSEIVSDRNVISVIDTSQAVAVPLFVAEGIFGVWSFG